MTDTFFSNEHPSIGFQPAGTSTEHPAPHLPVPTGTEARRAHLNSLFVTGCLSRANGFTVTSLAGPSSPLLCTDPIWKVPPGSCTMLPSCPSAGKGEIQSGSIVKHERGAAAAGMSLRVPEGLAATAVSAAQSPVFGKGASPAWGILGMPGGDFGGSHPAPRSTAGPAPPPSPSRRSRGPDPEVLQDPGALPGHQFCRKRDLCQSPAHTAFTLPRTGAGRNPSPAGRRIGVAEGFV